MADRLFDLWVATNVFLLITLLFRNRIWYPIAIGKIVLALGTGAFLVLAGTVATLGFIPGKHVLLYALWAPAVSYCAGKLLSEGVRQLIMLLLFRGVADELLPHWREYRLSFSRDDASTFRITAMRKVPSGQVHRVLMRW